MTLPDVQLAAPLSRALPSPVHSPMLRRPPTHPPSFVILRPQVTFNILIDIHGKQGAWAKAVEVLDQLHAQGCAAEPRT